MKTPLKYKTRLKGEYWAGISSCPHCDYKVDLITKYCIGFADSNIGEMVMMECPECFKFWYFHARPTIKKAIIRRLDLKTQ